MILFTWFFDPPVKFIATSLFFPSTNPHIPLSLLDPCKIYVIGAVAMGGSFQANAILSPFPCITHLNVLTAGGIKMSNAVRAMTVC